MIIPINKDFEKAYENDGWKGFTWKQLLIGGCALAITLGVALLLYLKFRIAPVACVYICTPLLGGIIFLGLFKYQRELSLIQLLRCALFTEKTKELSMILEEYNPEEQSIYTMDLPKIDKKRKTKRRKR